MRTVIATTNAFPSNSTKSPIELIANTLNALLDKILNACCPAVQNEYPYKAVSMYAFRVKY